MKKGLIKCSLFRAGAQSALTPDGWWITGGYADYYTEFSTLKISDGEFVYGDDVIC